MAPYIEFSDGELSRLPTVKAGDFIVCPTCGGWHKLELSDEGSDLLLFYRCGNEPYLGAVDGRLVIDC